MVQTLDRRFPHLADPLAEWRVDYEQFKAQYRLFREEEEVVLHQSHEMDDKALRQHEMLVCSFIAQAQNLALRLPDGTEGDDLRGEIDAALEALRITYQTMHTPAPSGPNPFSKFHNAVA